jgi:hypothetical protein
MAGRKPYYTSTELIEAVKRKINFPIVQQTFSEQDILDFSSEELFMSQVPSVLQYHEEFFTTDKVVPLEANVSKYDIPERAIGMKLRDIFYMDTQGNLHEMSNVGPSNSDIYKYNTNGYQTPKHYYIQGNEIVLVPDIQGSPTGSLYMMYYLRPNSLVLNERAAISNSFVKIVTVVNASLVSGDTLVIGDSTLTAGTDFAIGATNTATATNLATACNSLTGITATSSSADVSIFYTTLNKTFTTNNSTGLVIDSEIGIKCDSIPEHFEDGLVVDILQTRGGHNTLSFDVILGTGSVTSDTIFFPEDDIPSKFVIGDYICEQHECIIPQIPSDLHTLLAERTCMRILEALGDVQGLQTQTAKVGDLEARQAVIIDNRTEGSPRKIVNRHSLLRYGKSRRIRRGIF